MLVRFIHKLDEQSFVGQVVRTNAILRFHFFGQIGPVSKLQIIHITTCEWNVNSKKIDCREIVEWPPKERVSISRKRRLLV